eukprot:3498080-Prymnesium_polylepis.1
MCAWCGVRRAVCGVRRAGRRAAYGAARTVQKAPHTDSSRTVHRSEAYCEPRRRDAHPSCWCATPRVRIRAWRAWWRRFAVVHVALVGVAALVCVRQLCVCGCGRHAGSASASAVAGGARGRSSSRRRAARLDHCGAVAVE